MSGPNYEAHKAEGGWRIMEVGQDPPGMFVGDDWLRAAGFGPPSRSNIHDIVAATMFNVDGGVLARLNPHDLGPRKFPKQFAVDGLRDSGLVIAKR